MPWNALSLVGSFRRSGAKPAALNDPYQEGNDRQDQQDMDEPTHGVRSNDSKEP
jgi:hypothetical protein